MEYLEGETLADTHAEGPLPVDHVLRYAIQIADALSIGVGRCSVSPRERGRMHLA